MYILLSIGLINLLPNFISLYDSITGDDYATAESYDSGGIVAVLIYIAAFAITIFVINKINNQYDKNWPVFKELCFVFNSDEILSPY